MDGFKDVTLTWGEDEFVVPADQQMMLIARIEDAIQGQTGIPAVQTLLNGTPPLSRLAAAYGGALRHAGAKVSDADVYLTIQEDLSVGDHASAQKLQLMILGLLKIMSPPLAEKLFTPAVTDDEEKKP
ncbi:MAG: hypothetical protein GY947_07490 [Rhodobacteraceae bacterium]|nr:hypothetical protein [Paracoccaceae bacterium]